MNNKARLLEMFNQSSEGYLFLRKFQVEFRITDCKKGVDLEVYNVHGELLDKYCTNIEIEKNPSHYAVEIQAAVLTKMMEYLVKYKKIMVEKSILLSNK